MVNPAYIEWIWMSKAGEEDKLVHPNNVQAHRRQGWLIKSNPPPASSVAVETEAVVESVALEEEAAGESEAVVEPEASEEVPVAEEETSGESEALEEIQEPSTTKAVRQALTPKPRSPRPKKDK